MFWSTKIALRSYHPFRAPSSKQISFGLVFQLFSTPKSWFSHGFPMVFPWFSHGFPMVFPWFSHGFPIKSPCSHGFQTSKVDVQLGGPVTLQPSSKLAAALWSSLASWMWFVWPPNGFFFNHHSYGHLSIITGYKWDYIFYKWGYKYL